MRDPASLYNLFMQFVRFASFWLYPSLAASLLWLTWPGRISSRLSASAVLFVIGLFSWTLLEYILHRFVFHWQPRSRRLRDRIEVLHVRHHESPRDLDRLFVRPIYSIPISALVFSGVYVALGDVFSASIAMAGLWTGFLYYEFVHYQVHCTYSTVAFLTFQRSRHYHHHFMDPSICFGVTTPLWDWVFGTGK